MNYLIRFRYETYCQGFEFVTEIILINNVPSFETACNCIKRSFQNARQFENLTFCPKMPSVNEPSELLKVS